MNFLDVAKINTIFYMQYLVPILKPRHLITCQLSVG